MDSTLNNIGLCRRAGYVITGFDAVKRELELPKSRVYGILAASDLSEKSLKEIKFAADKYNKSVTVITSTMSEIERILKKRTGIIGVLDEGFYNLIIKFK